MNDSLSQLGFGPTFQSAFEAIAQPTWRPARVVRPDRGHVRVRDAEGERTAQCVGPLVTAEPSDQPAVGDWVALDVLDDGLALVHAVLPRRTAFMRGAAGRRTQAQCIAANVDTVFVMMGLDADYNLRRVERYLVGIAASGASAVVLLTKADLAADVAARTAEISALAPDVTTVAISSLRGDGLEDLDAWLAPGRTVAFVGSSGVGKSTLVNRLLGHARQATGAVRRGDDHGRHTTRHRELFVLPGRAAVIDTPGMRQLSPWAEADDLGAGFPDIEVLAGRCRFADCAHDREPGCAVRGAVAAGELDPDRLAAYHRLGAELRYAALRRAESGDHELRKRGKAGAKMIAQVKKLKRDRR